MNNWAQDAIFYHIYPLGLCGAPERNDFVSPPEPRLAQLHGWLDHIQSLGANAIYLGPLFESGAHGYDTADYFWVDRRLGTNDTLKELAAAMHQKGLRLILDGVFNHVGRHFWAFRDVQEKGRDSAYCDWFHRLDFNGRSPCGDPFWYEGWSGHYDLVKLNLRNPAVRAHLFQAVAAWIEQYDIDGLRLDAADELDLGFLQELAAFCRDRKPGFWLTGEIIHGDYRRWANPQTLDSVTNYECFKGLYSSLNDKNYFEIAYALNRQFGPNGLYRDLPLYNFADNHDVNRVASALTNPAHLFPLYSLLFTMPGVPSLYYGSEWGISGKRSATGDRELRPQLEPEPAAREAVCPELAGVISRLAALRHNSEALRRGDYRQVHVSGELLAFARCSGPEKVIVVINASDKPAALDLPLKQAGITGRYLVDLLEESAPVAVQDGKARLAAVWPRWLRVLQVRD